MIVYRKIAKANLGNFTTSKLIYYLPGKECIVVIVKWNAMRADNYGNRN